MNSGETETAPLSGSLVAGVRRNAVALISLCVALFSTGYNTWRNQTTEAHRNEREAAFKVLEEVGELHQIAQRRYYGQDHSAANWVDGWGRAALIRDMSVLVSPAVQARAQEAFSIWQANASELENGEGESEQRISAALDKVNVEVVHELQALR